MHGLHNHNYLFHQILMRIIFFILDFPNYNLMVFPRKKTQRGKEGGESWCQTFKRKVYCVETVKQMVARRIKEYSQQQGRAYFATFEISWANIEIEISPFVTVCVKYSLRFPINCFYNRHKIHLFTDWIRSVSTSSLKTST